MKFILTYLILTVSISGFSQQNLQPIHSFYKDQVFANKLSLPYNNGSFFPLSEGEYDLMPAIIDSSKQYYDITEILFQKHMLEFKGKDYFVTISPVFDFSYGKDLEDTLQRTMFQNTRGIVIEVDLFKNFSFSTSLYENQSRVPFYESSYYNQLGELYPGTDSSYHTQNAVIPGGARTKVFSGDGFDYAYSIGTMSYTPFKNIRISAGNNSQFVGDGHRSILLSDNSIIAPYYRVDWSINNKFSFVYLRSRLLNLLRRPASGSVEAYYESKGYSVNYFTYKPTEWANISLFEGSIWNRGDSITSTNSHPLYYNPIPVVSGLILKDKNEVSTLLGINTGIQLKNNHRAYGQVAINNFKTDKIAFQLGYRGYRFFGLNDLMFQVEYNNVPNEFYSNTNPRMNYVHYNLPLAHTKGNGFQEFIFRGNYEYKRVYLDISSVYYITDNYSPASLLPIYDTPSTSSENILNTTVEAGYRFNRKLNLCLFGAATLRNTDAENTSFFNFGLRTALINHYKDF